MPSIERKTRDAFGRPVGGVSSIRASLSAEWVAHQAEAAHDPDHQPVVCPRCREINEAYVKVGA